MQRPQIASQSSSKALKKKIVPTKTLMFFTTVGYQ